MTKQSLGLYIHWPFCKSKCPYCDFNSHVSSKIDHNEWLDAYLESLNNNIDLLKSRNIPSIYFGGGTPSLMEPYVVEKILDKIASISGLSNIETTLETNPTSFEYNKFLDFKAAGINRISIGIQSFREKNLKFLGREHSLIEAQETLKQASKIFDRFSFDLIYALPNQTVADWEKDLKEALNYSTTHISLYTLTIEKGTRFYKDYMDKKFIMPDEDLQYEFYNKTQEIMDAHGIVNYEVSNYAKPGFESQHNLCYWRYNDYLGIGPGAHSRITSDHIYAMHEYYAPHEWLENTMKGSGVREKTLVTPKEALLEMIMMNTRILEPIYFDHIEHRTQYKINRYYNALNPLEEHGFIKFIYEAKEIIGFKVQKSGLSLQNSIAAKVIEVLENE